MRKSIEVDAVNSAPVDPAGTNTVTVFVAMSVMRYNEMARRRLPAVPRPAGQRYGHWTLTISNSSTQPTGEDMTMALTFLDGRSATGIVTSRGIVHGTLPTTAPD